MTTIEHAAVQGAPHDAVKALARFVLKHGGFATAIVENIGSAGARIVVVGEDGIWGDVVVSNHAAALAACAAAKVDIAPAWSPQFVAGMPYRARR